MISLKNYFRNWKRQLRAILTSKRLVVLISLTSLLGTLWFVRLLKSSDLQTSEEPVDVVYQEAIKNKKAVSITTSLTEIPLEFIYPGTKVDVVNKNGAEVEIIVNDIYVLGITILEQDEQARVVLAVDDAEGESLLKKRQGLLSFIVHSNDKSSIKEGVEIIEF